MDIIKDKVQGDLTLTTDTKLSGMVTGNLTASQGTLILTGMVGRDLYVESGTTVELRGTVSGNVINRGGKLHIYGIVNGHVSELAGDTKVEPTAKIGDR
jgi:hypothetical protein